VLVDFWATWCGPCMNEAPHMVQINKDYASKGLVMIGISLDGAASDIAPVAKQKEMTWQQLWAPGDWHSTYAETWGVNSIPQTFLIGPDGAVLWRGHPAQLDEVLKKAFKEHPPQLVSPEGAQAGGGCVCANRFSSERQKLPAGDEVAVDGSR